MSFQVVRGEIDSKDATTRVVLPSPSRGSFPPFERVAETIATPRRRFPPHRHQGVEVLTYVTEGSATYVFGPGTADSLVPGAARLLTAPTSVSHAINPHEGTTVRWLAVVATLPDGTAAEPRLQSGLAHTSGVQPDGTVVRRVVGLGTGLISAAGLECEAVEFQTNGTSFRRVGHDRVAVCYNLFGGGSVDNRTLEVGEAALVENAGGVALQGEPGFHIVLVSAPRAPAPET